MPLSPACAVWLLGSLLTGLLAWALSFRNEGRVKRDCCFLPCKLGRHDAGPREHQKDTATDCVPVCKRVCTPQTR